ncbi:carboxylesterase family protein [Kineococcus sp. NPDC059986]|uniref:carboxylesterase/lipase family protein n=1 Tax=Kineococcus sp. NPDC059986 TaxID=3155538 RepID=UPI0034500640
MSTSTTLPTTATGPLAELTTGSVRGLQRADHAAFLGIPFAAPPVGPDRFAAPRPHEAWSGVRPAVDHGATPQRRPFGLVTTIPEPSIPGDSTLNVDVFTPAPGDRRARLPVFVWIHGGGYFAGSPASPWYDGRSFARDGVVTVTVSYRLGFDGFGWIDGAPLNRGLLDQVAALHWVRENIAAFGGNPGDVTIAGQSAGGGSVLALLSSPLATGLFHRVVCHSGAATALSVEEARAAGTRYADALGVGTGLADWRAVPEERITETEREFNVVPGRPALIGGSGAPDLAGAIATARAGRSAAATMAFVPVLDGEVLTQDVETALAGGHAADVDLVLGTARNEFAFALDVAPGEVEAVLRGAGVDDAGIARHRAELDRVGERFAASQVLARAGFRAALVRTAAARVRGGAGERTWAFDFAARSGVDGVAAHCHDLPYAFDVLDAPGVTEVLGQHPDKGLARRMHADWVGFTRSGWMPWPTVADVPLGAQRYGDGTGFDADAHLLDAQVAGL